MRHERAQQFAVRQQEAVRREFIDDLLYGRSELGSLVERAERFGLRLSYAHAVAVAVAEGTGAYVEGDVVSRRVERAVTGRFGERSVLLTTKNGRMVCIAPGDQHEVLLSFAEQAHAAAEGGRTAIGRPHAGAGGIVHSYQEALQVLDLADRLGFAEPVLHGADLLVYPVLARDRQALADLVRTTFGALLEARRPAALSGNLQRLFRRGLCRSAGCTSSCFERPRADLPAQTHSPAHRIRPDRPRAAVQAADRRHRSTSPGLACAESVDGPSFTDRPKDETSDVDLQKSAGSAGCAPWVLGADRSLGYSCTRRR